MIWRIVLLRECFALFEEWLEFRLQSGHVEGAIRVGYSQGNDVGMSYRSATFYTSDEQKGVAEETIADVDASGLWPGKVVTELAPVDHFWEAEPEHQDCLERIPNGYTCHFVRPGWKLPARNKSGREQAAVAG